MTKNTLQKSGERRMWAILGRSGGIYGFATSLWKAKEIQQDNWNIGNKKPVVYLVKFKLL